MAYHFRKLKQTLRIIPNTKSIGFSTRLNEGDQRKNQHTDGSSVNTLVDGNSVRVQCATSSDYTSVSSDEGHSRNGIHESCNVLRSPGDSELLYNLQPFLQVRTVSLPVAYKDIAQVMLPKILDDGDSKNNDPIESVFKSVRFTSDDILVHLNHSFSDSNTTFSTREQIPIDVLTQHHYHRLAYDAVPSLHDSVLNR